MSLSPPITGNDDLDAYLYNLQINGLDSSSGGTAVATTTNTSDVVSTYYPEKYIQIRYANSETGAEISTSPTGKKYYGIFNSITTTASSNPADYTWYQLTDTDGFGNTKYLFFTVLKGRNLKLYIGESAPTIYWALCPTTYIDLDIISEGFIDNTDFFDGYEPVAIVNGLPSASTWTGPNIVYDTATNKMYRWQAGQWYSNVLAADIEGALSSSNFSSSLRPVEVVSTLPSVGNFFGRVVLLTTNGKIYRYAATGWTAEVPTTDLTGTITSSQIADGSISGTKFASSLEPVTLVTSVPATKSTSTIYNSTDGKLYRWNGTAYITTVASTDISGILTNAQIESLAASKVTGTLTNSQIADLAAAKLTGQITGTQIIDGAISTAKIAAGAVTASQIAADTITASQIAANAITASELSAGSVTTAKIAAGAVTASEIAANTITSNQIAANTITAAQIAADTITSGQIAAGAITASEIAANAVTATAIAANAVTTAKLDALAITADKIAANAITSGKIAADAVTAGVIAAGAITSDKLATNSVIAGKIAAGSVTATEIDSRNLTIKDALGNILFGSGTNLNWSYIANQPSNIYNTNISINSNGTLTGAGAGQVTIGGLGYTGALDATKNNIYKQGTAPISGMSVNDVWFNTTTFAVYCYDGTNWILSGDKTSANTAAAISNQGAFATLNQITPANISTYIANAAIGNAQIGGIISSSNYVSGSAGWAIDKSGTAEFNNATFRGTLDVKSGTTGARTVITNSAIKVYDAAGILRVQIGDLTA